MPGRSPPGSRRAGGEGDRRDENSPDRKPSLRLAGPARLDTGAEFWGNADYTLHVDTGKLGLWPGGFLKVWADSGFGTNIFQDAGATVPVNTPPSCPLPTIRPPRS